MTKNENTVDRELREKAQPLIDIYKNRDNTYRAEVHACMSALQEASELIHVAHFRLTTCPLDSEHVSDINFNLSHLHGLSGDIDQASANISTWMRELNRLAMVIGWATAVETKKKRGAPRLMYVTETQNLMRVYEEVTGKRVVFPKGKDSATDEAYQSSTEFIRRSLNQIDNSIDTKKAITCIRNARTLDKQIKKILDASKARRLEK